MRRATAGAPRPQHYRRSTPPLVHAGDPGHPPCRASCVLPCTHSNVNSSAACQLELQPARQQGCYELPTTARGSSLSPTAPQHHQIAIPFVPVSWQHIQAHHKYSRLFCAEHPARLEPESSIALVGRPASRIIIDRLLLPKTHHQPQSRWYVNTTYTSFPHHNANQIPPSLVVPLLNKYFPPAFPTQPNHRTTPQTHQQHSMI